jgi:hypothetical protein
MHLRVLAGGPVEGVDVYRARPFDLDAQPLRPGVAHDELVIVLDERLAEAVERAAAADGLPTSFWASIVIESERALTTVSDDLGFDNDTLAKGLDAAACRPRFASPAYRGRRLVRYALALRHRAPRRATLPKLRLSLAVAQHTLIAWELTAQTESRLVADWARDRVAATPGRRALWEAAAAESGQTLAEWVGVQAARRVSD